MSPATRRIQKDPDPGANRVFCNTAEVGKRGLEPLRLTIGAHYESIKEIPNDPQMAGMGLPLQIYKE